MTDTPSKAEKLARAMDKFMSGGRVFDRRLAAQIRDELRRMDRAANLPTPVEVLLEALAEIRDRHVPDQPMSDGADEADYVRRQYSELRRIASAALAAYKGHRT